MGESHTHPWCWGNTDLPWAPDALCPCTHLFHILTLPSTQAKILEHDNVNYLKKILGELGMVLDQIEAELEKRKLEYQGRHWAGFMGCSPTGG